MEAKTATAAPSLPGKWLELLDTESSIQGMLGEFGVAVVKEMDRLGRDFIKAISGVATILRIASNTVSLSPQ